MYYPYLRGRQFELIALRELCEYGLLENVIPVIEPVKASSTLLNTIKLFNSKQKEFILIRNPTVGTFDKELEFDEEYKLKFNKLLDNSQSIITSGFIIDSKFKKSPEYDLNKAVAFCFNMDQIQMFTKFSEPFKSVFVPDASSARRMIKNDKIIFEDRFESQSRNADYKKNEDSFFSNDFAYFQDENFIGFSDFSIVGNEYTESGFAPFAVAIHIVYRDKDDSELRIHHFVSDSNEDINNPQNKFYEALDKLVKYPALKFEKNETYALNQFRTLYDKEIYPGLGTVKKLSIMHHIELVSKCLSENKE